jgi:hypothetical protein
LLGGGAAFFSKFDPIYPSELYGKLAGDQVPFVIILKFPIEVFKHHSSFFFFIQPFFQSPLYPGRLHVTGKMT